MQPLPVDAHDTDPEADSARDLAEAPPKQRQSWRMWTFAALCGVTLAVVVCDPWHWGYVSGNGRAEMAVSLDLVKSVNATAVNATAVNATSAKAAHNAANLSFAGEGVMIRLRDPSQCVELFDVDPFRRHGGKTARAHQCPGMRCSYDSCMSFAFTGSGEIHIGTYCLDAPRLKYEVQFWPCGSIRDRNHTKFSFEDDGHVRLMADPSRCVSVNDETTPTTEVDGSPIPKGPILELRDCDGPEADRWAIQGPSGHMAGAKLD